MRFTIAFLSFLLFAFAAHMETQGQWRSSSAYGYYSISVTGNTLFATIGDGWSKYKGVFRSTDGGKSWLAKANGLPNNADIIQITTDSVNTYLLTSSNGIYKTTDNGESWFSLSSDARATGGKLVVLSPDKMMVAKYSVIIVTTNGGVSWDTSKTGLPDGYSMVAANNYLNKYIIGTSAKGIFESTNNGASWSALNSGLSSSTNTAAFLSLCQGNKFYAALNDGKLYQLNYPNWSVISTTGVGGPSCVAFHNGALYAAIANNPYIYYTTTNGSSWVKDTLTNAPNVHINSLFPFNNSLMIATMHGTESNGLFSTSDRCVTYNQLSCAPACSVNVVLPYQNGRFFAGYFFTGDTGRTWIKRSTGLPSQINAMVNFGDTLYAGVQGGSSSKACVYKSVNDGQAWSYIGTGFTSTNLTILAMTKWNNRLIASAGDGIYVSSNMGESWVRRYALYGASALCANNSYIYGALTSNGKGAAVSSDGGETWTISSAGMNTSAAGKAIACINGKVIFGTQANGIYASTNNGVNWTAANNGLPATFEVTHLTVDGGYLWAALYVSGAAKIYYSSDEGSTWKDFSDGLPAGYRATSIRVFNGRLYAALSIGLFHREFSEITGIDGRQISEYPADFQLNQNYPNPFNPSTVIRYSLPEGGFISLKVYDLMGCEVKTLAEGYATSGTHEVTFNPDGLASGIYMYRLKSQRGTETKKMLLLR